MTYIAGGKYTTYRLIACEVVEFILKNCSVEDRIRFKKANTATPLNPFTSVEEYDAAFATYDRWKRSSRLSLGDLRLLVERYGLEVEQMLKEFPDKTEFAIALIRNGEVVYYGTQRSSDTLITIENRDKTFEIGSLTKVFTSTLLANFVLNNEVHTDSTINNSIKQ